MILWRRVNGNYFVELHMNNTFEEIAMLFFRMKQDVLANVCMKQSILSNVCSYRIAF